MRATVAHLALLALAVSGRVIDFEVDAGAVADKDDSATWWANGRALNATLQSLQPGDVFVVPNRTYHIMGGIRADNLTSVTIQIDGTLSYAQTMTEWPREEKIGKDKLHQVLACWYGVNWQNVTFTSSGVGTMDGNGATWWGVPGVGYLEHLENRPRLIQLKDSQGLLFENIFFKNSPYWTFTMEDVDGLEVRHCSIDAKRDDNDGHSTYDLTAFNTDGFDVSGRNVWIHDSEVWNQDDCFTVKANTKGVPSENMLFERVKASGMGLTIGSIGEGYWVRNITFRDISMHKTTKGIYMKFRSGPALIENITFENIFMDAPEQYAIWIGPAQQSDSIDLCAAHPCSLCWPSTPLSECNPPEATYLDITLRNVTVNNAEKSPGLIYANEATPMKNIVFEDVVFNNPGTSPWSDYYYCKHAEGVARGGTWPVPPCFKDETGTCVSDGDCTKAGRTCCSGDDHSTEHCSSGKRCGCVSSGDCATHEYDCCSGKGHKTAACSLGIGYRCDDASDFWEIAV